MQKVERSIQKLLPHAPMNALLDLLGKYRGLHYKLRCQFSDSRRPGRNLSEPLEDDGDDDDDDDDDDGALALRECNENGDYIDTTHMPHLIPRAKFVDGVGGVPDVWQQGQTNECLRYTKHWVQCCGSKECSVHFVCKAGTDKNSHTRTCSSCERKGCKCRFAQCCVEGCLNHMCTCRDFHAWDPDDAGRATGCFSILYPAGEYGQDHIKAERKQYCAEHEPLGAELFFGWYHTEGYED
jgi:hypothetical protein